MNTTALIPIIVSALLVVVVGGGNWLALEEVKKIRATTGELEAQISAAAAIREQGTRSRSLETDIAESEAFVASHIVRPEGIVDFLAHLERVGTPLGATVTVASVGDVDVDGRIAVSLSMNGSFDGVMRTLGVLEHGQYALSVKSVTMEAREEGLWDLTGTFLVVAQKTP